MDQYSREFIADYLSQPALRTRIRRGWDNVLLDGEYQLNRSLVRSERLSV